MKRWMISLVLLAVVGMALGTAGSAFAQAPSNTPTSDLDGYLHAEMVTVYAQALGITEDELNTRLESGETIPQIAYSLGMTSDQIQTLIADARPKAIDLALANGTLTQEQADWLKQTGYNQNGQAGGRGRSGRIAGAGSNSAGVMPGGNGAYPNCPYSPTN